MQAFPSMGKITRFQPDRKGFVSTSGAVWWGKWWLEAIEKSKPPLGRSGGFGMLQELDSLFDGHVGSVAADARAEAVGGGKAIADHGAAHPGIGRADCLAPDVEGLDTGPDDDLVASGKVGCRDHQGVLVGWLGQHRLDGEQLGCQVATHAEGDLVCVTHKHAQLVDELVKVHVENEVQFVGIVQDLDIAQDIGAIAQGRESGGATLCFWTLDVTLTTKLQLSSGVFWQNKLLFTPKGDQGQTNNCCEVLCECGDFGSKAFHESLTNLVGWQKLASSLDVRTRRISEKFLRIFHVFEVFLKIFF
jgi:hypothetical protein